MKKLSVPSKVDALKGRDVALKIEPIHFVSGRSMLERIPGNYEQALFGMGCFWGAEKLFWDVKGVYVTSVGYAGGSTLNPTYEEACSGMTGHAEVVNVVYDPSIIDFKTLLIVFWENHNPTEGMQQGNDVGTQYRSAIYTFTPAQTQLAEETRAVYTQLLGHQLLENQNERQITTEIKENQIFYFAETYHQQYLAKNRGGYCPNHGCDATGLPSISRHL